jgi:hypothetical protein
VRARACDFFDFFFRFFFFFAEDPAASSAMLTNFDHWQGCSGEWGDVKKNRCNVGGGGPAHA